MRGCCDPERSPCRGPACPSPRQETPAGQPPGPPPTCGRCSTKSSGMHSGRYLKRVRWPSRTAAGAVGQTPRQSGAQNVQCVQGRSSCAGTSSRWRCGRLFTCVAGAAAGDDVGQELSHLARTLHCQHLRQALQVKEGSSAAAGEGTVLARQHAEPRSGSAASSELHAAAQQCGGRPAGTCAAPERSTADASERSFSSSQGTTPPSPSSPMSAQRGRVVGCGGRDREKS